MKHALIKAATLAPMLAGALLAGTSPVLAKTAYDGVWLFDDTPPTPGVTMMQITSKGGKIAGSVTTKWYGPVEMMNPHIEGGVLKFEARNLNDRDHPTRSWSVAIEDGHAHLKGRIWESEVDSTGRPLSLIHI